MNIRRAIESDISIIHKLAHEIWWPTYKGVLSDEQIEFMLADMYSQIALKSQADSGMIFLLAERDKQPVAFAGYTFDETEKKLIKLHKLYILPSEQGKGTGKKLIEHIAKMAKAAGYALLELNVNRGNPALGFYKKLGFKVHQTVDIPYHKYVLDDYVMRLEL